MLIVINRARPDKTCWCKVYEYWNTPVRAPLKQAYPLAVNQKPLNREENMNLNLLGIILVLRIQAAGMKTLHIIDEVSKR